MANPFDKFDEPIATGNAFDRFDVQERKSLAKPQQTLSRTDKYLKGLKDPLDAGVQLVTNMLPDSVVNAGNKLNNFVADKTGLVRKLPEGGINQQLEQDEKLYQSQRAEQGETGIDGYRMLGNVVNPANLAISAKLPQVASTLGRVGVGAAGGGVAAGLTAPVVENTGEFWQEKAKQVGTGAVFGGAMPMLGAGISRVVSPKASVDPKLKLLKESGVNPTIGQTLGGWANKTEEKLQSLPIMGDMIASARQGATGDFEAAAFNKALKPIGQELPDGLSGRDAIIYTENALKETYDSVLTKIGAIKIDDAFNAKLTNLQGMVTKLVMPKAEKAKFNSAVSDLKQSIDDNGYMTSDAYKALESSLGQDARKLGSSTNIYEGKLSPAVKQLQGELRGLLERQSGTHANELKAANSGWANFKRVQRAASSLGADEGSFTPAQYQNAVKSLAQSKGGFARGSAIGQDLGDAGKKILTNKVPDSGTAARALYGIGALATGTLNPAIPLSLIGGAGLYTKPMQKLLTGSITARPKLAAPTAKFLRKGSTYVAPSSGAIGLGLLNQ